MDAQTQTADAELSTKERLLQAAVEVFADKGFQAATVRDICQLAGTNVAAVNYHFGDKERLYGAMLWHIFERHYADHETTDDPSLTPEERLAAYIRIEVNNIYGKKCECGKDGCKSQPFAIFLMEMAHPSAHLAAIVDHFIRPDHLRVQAMMRDILGADAPQDLIDRCCDSLWGQFLHHVFSWPIDAHLTPDRPHPAEDLETLAEHITTITLGGIAAVKARLNQTRKQS